MGRGRPVNKERKNYMKEKTQNPYGTYSLTKIEAPKKPTDPPKSGIRKSETDLRGGNKR